MPLPARARGNQSDEVADTGHGVGSNYALAPWLGRDLCRGDRSWRAGGSMDHLAAVVGDLGDIGHVTTSGVYKEPLPYQGLLKPLAARK